MITNKIIPISMLTTVLLSYNVQAQRPTIKPQTNAYQTLQQTKTWRTSTPLKLHLGCGQNHLKGYVNIDFPPTEHTVQSNVAADIFADLTTLSFPNNTVDEIRSHHVFEHFDRQAALAFLCKWHQWLKVGGELVIETPDFEKSIQLMLSNKYTYNEKQGVLRHIFGSHEAHWAIHCDGWYKEKYEHVLEALGFEKLHIRHHSILKGLIPSITVTAIKKRNISLAEMIEIAKTVLEDSLVSKTESRMYKVWCRALDNAVQRMSHE